MSLKVHKSYEFSSKNFDRGEIHLYRKKDGKNGQYRNNRDFISLSAKSMKQN